MSTSESVSFYIKTQRSFSVARRYAWILTIVIGVGGQFYPLLGLLVPPIMAALLLMSLFKGKYWCGNFCPHGSLFDNILQPLSLNRRIPSIFGSRFVVILVFIVFVYNLGRRFVSVYATLGTDAFFERLGLVFSTTYLVVILLGGLLALSVNARAWCRFCPMGTMQGVAYKLGQVTGLAGRADDRVTVTHPAYCHSCARCARVCPMQLWPYREFKDGNQVRDESCIRCNTCVQNCPAGILQLAGTAEAEALHSGASLEGFDRAQVYRARIAFVREWKEGVRSFTFELLEQEKMDFTPGQFILVEIDPAIEMYRAYTISGSGPSSVTVTIKKLSRGYGTNLIFEQFREGREVRLKGPLGRDLRIDPAGRELLFMANGIGITPFVAAVENYFQNGDADFSGRATLLYGARFEEDLVFDHFFAEVAAKNSRFEYHPVLSRPRGDEFARGYVTDLLEELTLSPETQVYICGTGQMAAHARQALLGRGIPAEQIHIESFD